MSEEQLSFAFEQIPKGREVQGAYKTALLSQYAACNHGDCLPYEDNRVRLHPAPDNPHGYVNASHVTVSTSGVGKPSSWVAPSTSVVDWINTLSRPNVICGASAIGDNLKNLPT